MNQEENIYQLIVVGGGPAGVAAAISAFDAGLRKILIVERDKELGGILNQCIHNGFGLHYFKEELTGPEYASRFIKILEEKSIEIKTDTMVLELSDYSKKEFPYEIHMVSSSNGYEVMKTISVVLAMGCRERTRGALMIPGTRPAGVMTAGAAQKYVNMTGYLPGKNVVILGSGDIGLIMARRMTLEGANVLACLEVMPYAGGLNRNIVQCLHDYDIPLYLSHTVTQILGHKRVSGIIMAQVDENKKPIPGTEKKIVCDTLLLSVGLIPENELTYKAGVNIDQRTKGPVVNEAMETSISGIFACGNVVHVHDLVDFVTLESIRAGQSAAKYILGMKSQDQKEKNPYIYNKVYKENEKSICKIYAGENVGYTVPQKIDSLEKLSYEKKPLEIYFRVRKNFSKSMVRVLSGGKILTEFKREYMFPGEMEKIVLSSKILDLILENNSLEICAEDI